MDKGTILAELKKNGNISVFQRTPTWEKAFDLYNAQNRGKLKPNCSLCFRKVKTWLEK